MGVVTLGPRPFHERRASRHHVYNVTCGCCLESFDLKPPLCPACLSTPLEGGGPYRTSAAVSTNAIVLEAGRQMLLKQIAGLKRDLDHERWRSSRVGFLAVAFAALAGIMAFVHYLNHHR